MEAIEFFYFVLVTVLYIFAVLRICQFRKEISELNDKADSLDLRIDNLVERFKQYDKELEELKKIHKKHE